MRRRDMQFALINALGGGFDATGTRLAAPDADRAAQAKTTQQAAN